MGDSNRKIMNDAVEHMRNMNSDVSDTNGQYRQLGFSPSRAPSVAWNMTNHLQANSFITPCTVHDPESQLSFQTMNNQCDQSVSFDYGPRNQMFAEQYDERLNENDLYATFNIYRNVQQDVDMFSTEYKFVTYNMNSVPDSAYLQNHQDANDPTQNHRLSNCTPLIDNVVGNWTANISGTYTPFGNIPLSNMSSIFDNRSDIDCMTNVNSRELEQDTQEYLDKTNEELRSFHFNKDVKKPRIIAEIKPMRPSYSDVLLKSVPQANKKEKPELKCSKQKKETSKSVKSEKVQKVNGLLSRSNTNSEIKDLPTDKTNHPNRNCGKNAKDVRTGQLNRKWVSLDNVTESFNTKAENIDSHETRKTDGINLNKGAAKAGRRKTGKVSNDCVDTDSGSGRNDSFGASKNSLRKGVKNGSRQRSCDSFGNVERPAGKRGQRNRRRDSHVPLGIVGQKLKSCLRGWWKFLVGFVFWLFHLVSDICNISIHLIHDGAHNLWSWIVINGALLLDTTVNVLKRIPVLVLIYDKFKKDKVKEEKRSTLRTDLKNNINMPMTGDEAMKRLLACKGKDPYSILGVVPACSDDDIKRYYKKQAVLVHPDKNKQPGAEEAFKILVHAFDMIGEPERRGCYDRGVAESVQVEQAWTELTELLAQFQQKVEAAARTIRCSACGSGHKRMKIDRPSYAARNCSTCKIHHSAREGDIWAEARCFGFLWHYYACMEGGVYDITEWAGCQKTSLTQLRPDTHNVQYRIALGKQNRPSRRHSSSPHGDDAADLENLLSRFCNQSNTSQHTRRKNKKSGK